LLFADVYACFKDQQCCLSGWPVTRIHYRLKLLNF
jgi:hypothetical protein